MADFLVTTATDDGTGNIAGTLSRAIKEANAAMGDDRIILKTNVTMSGVMTRLVNSNITITSDDPATTGVVEDNFIISGGNSFRPLFVKSGTVAIENLKLNNGKALGGSSNGGGGGAGMGGALFVYKGSITVDNVGFAGNQAIGGNGNQTSLKGGNGGGGMFGDSGGDGGGGLFGSSTDG
ncbi:MAG: hypothetical protein AAF889_10345, partial [Cyanobacteria bacterium P01_D01_bin.73]